MIKRRKNTSGVKKTPKQNINDISDKELDEIINNNKLEEKKKLEEEQKNKESTPPSILTQDYKLADDIIKIAEEMYTKLKNHVKQNPDFIKLEDKRKLDYFREKLGYKDFMTEYPIVTRYLICMGQYSSKAFRRMLDKIRMIQHPPPDKRDKGYMEDQWVRRQADYIKYLWEAYQKSHINTAEANWVWENSYKKLKGEFDDFRNKYKEVEEHTKIEKERLKAKNALDLLERLKTGKQELNNQDQVNLINALKDRVYKRRMMLTMQELLKTRAVTPPSSEGIGHGDATNEDRPTMTMVEHVDSERINEIPENLLLDDKTAKKLPGYMETINEEDD